MRAPPPRILLSHPHNAEVARRSAEALQGTMLEQYVTGLAWHGDSHLARRLFGARADNRRVAAGVPLRALWGVEGFARLAGRAFAGRARMTPYDALFAAHDLAVSLLPWPKGVNAVYCYEDGAALTFERASARGMGRIYDFPTPHWKTVEAIQAQEGAHWGQDVVPALTEPHWKQLRKDHELSLATSVVVASAFTKESVVRTGKTTPVHVVPYGFPVDDFEPRSSPPSGVFTALAVGNQSVRKGTLYLLEAWSRLQLPNARLVLVGPLNIPDHFKQKYSGTFEHIPHRARRELHGLYAAADVLVFPTLCDGFGLVIQEAMCTGVPVITTPSSGGPECLTSGEHGWIIPPANTEALMDALERAYAARNATAEMGRQARKRAAQYPWSAAALTLRTALGSS